MVYKTSIVVKTDKFMSCIDLLFANKLVKRFIILFILKIELS
jgi:hypothetical protein